MSADRIQIDTEHLQIDRDSACRLHAVAVHRNAKGCANSGDLLQMAEVSQSRY